MFFLCSCQSKHEADCSSLLIDCQLLEEGDLILRRGMGIGSRAVQHSDSQSAYSHIGILVCRSGKWMVVHCVPGEDAESGGEELIKCDSLTLFLRNDRAETGAVYRYDTLAEVRKNVAAKALALSEKHIVFDHLYNLTDSNRMYCTELVNYVYDDVGIDITEGRRHRMPGFKYPLIFPSDIINHLKVKEIQRF